MQPIGINQRMASGFNDLDILQPGGAQMIGDKLGRALNVFRMFGERADAGDAQEILEFFKESFLILRDELIGAGGHTPML